MTAYGISDQVSVSNLRASQYATVSTRSFVSASMTEVQLLPGNPNRVGVIIYNDSNASMYVGFGSDAVTLDSFTLIIQSHSERGWDYRYSGEIRALWSVETGAARVTELT